MVISYRIKEDSTSIYSVEDFVDIKELATNTVKKDKKYRGGQLAQYKVAKV